MAHFILTYHGGSQPESPQAGQAHMEKYMNWIAQLDAEVPQQPLKNTHMLGDTTITPIVGYTIIKADSIQAAREIAQSCPFLDMDNSAMQVSELVDME